MTFCNSGPLRLRAGMLDRLLKRALHEMGGWGNRVKVKKGIGWEIKSGKTGAVATSQKISASLSRVLKTSAMALNQHSQSEAAFKSAQNCFKQPVVFSIAFKCQLKDVEYPIRDLLEWAAFKYLSISINRSESAF